MQQELLGSRGKGDLEAAIDDPYPGRDQTRPSEGLARFLTSFQLMTDFWKKKGRLDPLCCLCG